MKKVILFIFITFGLNSNTYAFSTMGVPQCTEWNKARVATNSGKNLDANFDYILKEFSFESYVLGYLNAYATHLSLSQNADILKGKSKEQLMELVDVECQKDPSLDLSLSSFMVSLKLLASPKTK